MAMTALILALPLALAAQPCADCHGEQHRAWTASAHAGSAASPLYLAMREWARSDAGEAAAATCATCHTVPLASGGRSAAVECGACHLARHGKGSSGELVIDPGSAVLAVRPSAAAPHEVAATLALAGDAPCQPCHAQLINPAGVPLCTTGPEAATREVGAPCIACHRPHAFAGTTSEVLRRAATVSLDRRGDTLAVTVIARGVGHALPTGAALRQVRLEVEFLDARGGRLSDNLGDPEALFARLLADEDGKAPAPPWRARAVARDSRLAAGERRVLSYAIPGGARSADARLVYHRAPPALLARFSLADNTEFAPRVMARATVALQPEE